MFGMPGREWEEITSHADSAKSGNGEEEEEEEEEVEEEGKRI